MALYLLPTYKIGIHPRPRPAREPATVNPEARSGHAGADPASTEDQLLVKMAPINRVVEAGHLRDLL